MGKTIEIRKLFRLACEECGSELVEFAMTAAMMMGLVVAVIGFSLAMYTYHFLSSAAQEGARFAEVRGNTWSTYTTTACSTSSTSFTMVYDCTASAADVQNYVRSLVTGGITASKVTAVATWPGQTADGTTAPCATDTSQSCLVKVTVSYTFDFFPFVFRNFPQMPSSLSMSATAEGVILQ